jgi:hypothetical protein
MVIISVHAPVAVEAMIRTPRLEDLAYIAKLIWLEMVQQHHKLLGLSNRIFLLLTLVFVLEVAGGYVAISYGSRNGLEFK